MVETGAIKQLSKKSANWHTVTAELSKKHATVWIDGWTYMTKRIPEDDTNTISESAVSNLMSDLCLYLEEGVLIRHTWEDTDRDIHYWQFCENVGEVFEYRVAPIWPPDFKPKGAGFKYAENHR